MSKLSYQIGQIRRVIVEGLLLGVWDVDDYNDERTAEMGEKIILKSYDPDGASRGGVWFVYDTQGRVYWVYDWELDHMTADVE